MPKTIAIVDDDEAVRDSLSALLASAGYAFRAFASGAAFVEATGKSRPDGVILDHRMSGMTGVELAERLKSERPGTVIVMISGNLTSAERARAESAGVAAILEKPFSDDALIAAIETALE
ncbi:MAG: response regulator [Maricaulaceae bacterium]|jgi:two-component system response regulator FixJ